MFGVRARLCKTAKHSPLGAVCEHRFGRTEEISLLPKVRLFGTDGEEIRDLQSWLAHAPPEKGEAQWKDGYSAKEQAKVWLRPGHPAVPEEHWNALAPLVGGIDEIFARPEYRTRLDNGRQRRPVRLRPAAGSDEWW